MHRQSKVKLLLILQRPNLSINYQPWHRHSFFWMPWCWGTCPHFRNFGTSDENTHPFHQIQHWGKWLEKKSRHIDVRNEENQFKRIQHGCCDFIKEPRQKIWLIEGICVEVRTKYSVYFAGDATEGPKQINFFKDLNPDCGKDREFYLGTINSRRTLEFQNRNDGLW